MSSSSGLWPREKPRPTESHGEGLVWDALRKGLPAGWYAWHSVRVRLGPGRETEGDFVIAAPDRGLLALEVKGGRIDVRDGRFSQNGREMDLAPRQQGLSFVRALIDRLHAEACGPPAFGVACCFPDTAFDAAPSQDDVAGLVLGAQDLPWMERALPALLERACPPARPAIIVTDFHLLADEARGVRMHIALTRALVAARIVVAGEDLARDPVLSFTTN